MKSNERERIREVIGFLVGKSPCKSDEIPTNDYRFYAAVLEGLLRMDEEERHDP